jgi:GT2 family glycosyltransferase
MKILIGCPTCDRYKYCIDEWIERVNNIINNSKDHEIDYLLVDNSKEDNFFNKLKEKNVNILKAPHLENVRERITHSRNLLREKLLKENYDYFFSLEQDVMPEKDILDQLLKADKKIISAYYAKPTLVGLKDKETGKIHNAVLEFSLIWKHHGIGIKRTLPQEIKNKGIISVGGFGIGCVLINKEVLEKIKFKFIEGKRAFDDLLFCQDAEDNDYKLFLESNIHVKHLHKPWDSP